MGSTGGPNGRLTNDSAPCVAAGRASRNVASGGFAHADAALDAPQEHVCGNWLGRRPAGGDARSRLDVLRQAIEESLDGGVALDAVEGGIELPLEAELEHAVPAA